MKDTAFVASIKEFGRVILIAVLPVLIIGIESGATLKVIFLTIGLAALKGVDKYLHERKDIDINGLSPF